MACSVKLLPSLRGVTPRLLVPEQPAPPDAPPGASPRLVLRERKGPRATPQHVRVALRHLWKADVKRWCDVQERAMQQREDATVDCRIGCLGLERDHEGTHVCDGRRGETLRFEQLIHRLQHHVLMHILATRVSGVGTDVVEEGGHVLATMQTDDVPPGHVTPFNISTNLARGSERE